MMQVTITAVLLLIVALWCWRQWDHRADRAARKRLIASQSVNPSRFDLAMVKDLPEPARRYFQFTLQPGTPLYTVADIRMSGKFGMGSKSTPRYMSMTAEQTLAPPAGFIWKMRTHKGLMQLSGSDSETWTRFWLMGLLPLARIGGTDDHARSAFGRCAAEAVFWTPAALLPGQGIRWEGVDEATARVHVSHVAEGSEQTMEQTVELTVAEDGRPLKVSFLRWSNANSDKEFRLQAFGGYLSHYRDFEGFRLPTHIEAGNFFETEDYFPFFVVDVLSISYPQPDD